MALTLKVTQLSKRFFQTSERPPPVPPRHVDGRELPRGPSARRHLKRRRRKPRQDDQIQHW